VGGLSESLLASPKAESRGVRGSWGGTERRRKALTSERSS